MKSSMLGNVFLENLHMVQKCVHSILFFYSFIIVIIAISYKKFIFAPF